MPRRRGKRNRIPSNLDASSGDSSSLVGQPRDNLDLSWLAVVVIYWAYAHWVIALKCVEKLNNLLFQVWGYDRLNIPRDSILESILYWRFSVLSIPLISFFIYVVMKFAPAIYIVFGDVMFMCIFWVLDQSALAR